MLLRRSGRGAAHLPRRHEELPATLLLRPLNPRTLATALFAEAARGTYTTARWRRWPWWWSGSHPSPCWPAAHAP